MSVSNVYEEYASNALQIKALEEKQDQLKPLIIEMMDSEKIEKLETSLGKFSITNLKKWTYTEKVTEMSEALKAQKAKEESTGDATFDEVPSLRFTASKL